MVEALPEERGTLGILEEEVAGVEEKDGGGGGIFNGGVG